jgi:heme exporter protein A
MIASYHREIKVQSAFECSVTFSLINGINREMAETADITDSHRLFVTLENVSLSRGDRVLIDNLSLSLSPGKLVYITGENGIGKTTLLLALAGLLYPEQGQINYTIAEHAYRAFDCASLMVQPDGASRGFSAEEDLRFFAKLGQHTVNTHDLLERVGLKEAAAVRTEGLSLGQRKRLSLAKIMAAKRPLWLLDEPFSALDKDGRDFVASVIKNHLDKGGIALIASHNPTPIAGHKAKTLHLTQADS